MSDPEWTSPRMLREYYVGHAFPDLEGAERALFDAVMSGEVRARRPASGHVYGPEWLREKIKRLKVIPGEPHALPPDIELSIEDAMKKWPRAGKTP
jgi:hypothetical protein